MRIVMLLTVLWGNSICWSSTSNNMDCVKKMIVQTFDDSFGIERNEIENECSSNTLCYEIKLKKNQTVKGVVVPSGSKIRECQNNNIIQINSFEKTVRVQNGICRGILYYDKARSTVCGCELGAEYQINGESGVGKIPPSSFIVFNDEIGISFSSSKDILIFGKKISSGKNYSYRNGVIEYTRGYSDVRDMCKGYGVVGTEQYLNILKRYSIPADGVDIGNTYDNCDEDKPELKGFYMMVKKNGYP